ncbi:alpha/beta hydrolase [Actinokineospora soli]
MARLTAALTALALLATACTSTPAAQQQPDPLAELAAQQLQWTDCESADLKDGGARCATVKVPVDYRDPTGRTLDIAIARKEATDPGRRRGVLFTNPGGPGAEGRSLALGLEGQAADAVYDTIGMDPRGVGGSTQLLCDPHEEIALPSRPTEADLPKFAEAAKADADACAAGGGDLRKHITSMNTARDIDLIRRVLREEKISFLGYSYGTFLGPLYGEMFPDRVDRIVLDSAQDPRQTWREVEVDDVEANRANVSAWLAWTAERDAAFGLGATPDDVRAALEAIVGKLREGPIGELADVTTFDTAVGAGARYRSLWAAFAWAVADLRAGGDAATEAAAELTKIANPDEGNALGQEERPNGTYQAILCDWSWPTNPAAYEADILRVGREVPYGDSVSGVAPNACTFTTGRDPMVEIGPRRYPQGLVVQGEGDTQTAYASGKAAAEHLDLRMITVKDSGVHGYYGTRKNACVDDAVNAYLIDGTLPDADVECAAVADKRPDIEPGQPAERSGALSELITAVK